MAIKNMAFSYHGRLTIENLTFSYGDKLLFDNFNIEFPEGKITVLSGPSGCGKTTLLRLIAGLERPDRENQGEIPEGDPGNKPEGMAEDKKPAERYKGKAIDEKTSELYEVKAVDDKNSGVYEKKADEIKANEIKTSELYENTDLSIVKKNGRQLPLNLIAVMFQEDRLLPGINAKKQLEIAVPGCDAKKWLKAVELENESDTVPEKLSGGMKRRLALARCLAYAEDKELILLDEPFTGIDPGRIASISEVIRKMKKTVIVTGHTEETLKLADNIVVMEKR